MKHGRIGGFAAAMGVAAASVYALTFTWTGGGGDDDWDTTQNWSSGACANCSPDDTNDDALFSDEECGWGTVELVTEEIGELEILADVDFTPDAGTPTLTVDKLTIHGTIECGETIVTIENATIEVN